MLCNIFLESVAVCPGRYDAITDATIRRFAELEFIIMRISPDAILNAGSPQPLSFK